MKFGAVPLKDALGATAVHSIRQGELVLKKGTLIGPKEVAALNRAGVKEIVVARGEAGDVAEGARLIPSPGGKLKGALFSRPGRKKKYCLRRCWLCL